MQLERKKWNTVVNLLQQEKKIIRTTYCVIFLKAQRILKESSYLLVEKNPRWMISQAGVGGGGGGVLQPPQLPPFVAFNPKPGIPNLSN
jgi:hypothetical protein